MQAVRAAARCKCACAPAATAEPLIRLGSGFQLDGDLAERLASLEGLANVQLTIQRGANLRLVA